MKSIQNRKCLVEGCTKKVNYGNFVCSMHIARKRKTGSYFLYKKSHLEKMFEKIELDPITECWNYKGATSGTRDHQYGTTTNAEGKKFLVHRFIYEYCNGKIPEDMLLCHTCDNTYCCNPQHHFIGTQFANIQDALAKQRIPHGSKKWNSKLKEEDILIIRGDKRHVKVIAKEYNVNYNTINDVKKGRTWSWVKG